MIPRRILAPAVALALAALPSGGAINPDGYPTSDCPKCLATTGATESSSSSFDWSINVGLARYPKPASYAGIGNLAYERNGNLPTFRELVDRMFPATPLQQSQVPLRINQTQISSATFHPSCLTLDSEAVFERLPGSDSGGDYLHQIVTDDAITQIDLLPGGTPAGFTEATNCGPGWQIRVWRRAFPLGDKNGNGYYVTTSLGTPLTNAVICRPQGALTTDNNKLLFILNETTGIESKGSRITTKIIVQTLGTNDRPITVVSSLYDGVLTTDPAADGAPLSEETLIYSAHGTKKWDYTITRTVKVQPSPLPASYNSTTLITTAGSVEDYDDYSPVASEGGEPGMKRLMSYISSGQTTYYDYYYNLAVPSEHGRLKSVQRPDGSWTAWEYAFGTVPTITEYSSWTNVTLANKTAARKTVTTVSGGEFTTETSIATQLVAQSNTKLDTTDASQTLVTFKQFDGSRWLATTTAYFPDADPPTISSGRVKFIKHPDETLTTYEYTGPVTNHVVTVTTGAPDGSSTFVSDGIEVTTTYNSGNVAISQSTRAISQTSKGMFTKSVPMPSESWDVGTPPEFDALGRPVSRYFGDGTSDRSEYTCCGLKYHRARDGSATTYSIDPLSRVYLTTTTLGSRSTTTTHTFDVVAATGQLQSTASVAINGSAAGTTTTIRDLLGRTVSVTSPGPQGVAETTSYAYSSNGLTVTTTNPDGGKVVKESYPDGKIKSVSGNATIAEGYSYDTHAGGGLKTTITTASGTGGVRTTYTDMAGRVFKTEATAPHDGTATTITSYNARGQAETVTSSGQPSVKYIYDGLGRRVATCTNRNGDILFDNTAVTINGVEVLDSWTGIVTDYVPAAQAPAGIGNCRRTIASTRLESGLDVPVSTTYQSVDGLRSRAERIGVTGATTTVSTLPLDGAWTSTTTYPDTTLAVVETTMLAADAAGVQQTVTTRKTSGTDPAILEVTTALTDALGRTASTTSGRGHVTNYEYYPNGGQVTKVTQVHEGPTDPNDPDLVTSYAYALTPLTGNQGAETATRTITTTLPNGTKQYRTTNILGQTLRQWGSQLNPVAYTYDAAGRLHTHKSYRANVSATADTFPTVAGDTTTWNHDPSGVLLEKDYPGTGKTSYTYDAAGRVLTRTWARPISATNTDKVKTEYAYHTSGQLRTVTYNDGTTNLAYTYDRLGRSRTVTQGTGGSANIWAYAYNDDAGTTAGTTLGAGLGLYSETITYGGAGFSRTLRHHQDALLRDTGRELGISGADLPEHQASYAYNTANGILETVAGGVVPDTSTPDNPHDYNAADTFTYGYVAGSGLIGTVTKAASGGNPALVSTRTYEPNRDVLAAIQNNAGGTVRSNYDYSLVNGGVNNLGQRMGVRTSFDLGTTLTANPGDTSWGYDSLGQLTSAADSATAANCRAYQYDTIGNRLFAEKGAALIPATPDVNTTSYTPDALNQYDAITPHLSDGRAGTPVVPVFDDDGNMTTGPLSGTAGSTANHLKWDAENRLIEVRGDDDTNVIATYAYDALSRRIATIVGTGGTAVTTLYVYDGFNCIAEYAGAALSKTRTWGLDLSGSLQGAGGVGGLLAEKQGDDCFYPTYDGNGNISEYLAADGTPAAHFEYDPFGATVVDTDDAVAPLFAYRFSTKPLDFKTGLYYYGYRWYDPLTGRWPSRDPINEDGGLNLYGFVGNDGVDGIDQFGMLGMVSWSSYKLVAKSFINGVPDVGGWGKAGVMDGSNWRLGNFAATIGLLPAFHQLPKDDSKNGEYRLYVTTKVKFCCDGTTLVSFKTSDEDMDGGMEISPLRIKGTIDGILGEKRINESSVQLLMESWGHPDIKSEIGMQMIRKRTSTDIWNKTIVTFSCSTSVGSYEIESFNGSRFPSRKLWIDGKEERHVKQGKLSDLWTSAPDNPVRVAE